MADPREWRPLPSQERALRSSVYELLFGGAAGPGKSTYLVMAPLRWVEHPAFRAILLRNSFPELERTLIAKSRDTYHALGGSYHEQRRTWTFPSGAQIAFGYLERDADVLQYQGAEYTFVGFDELTHFSEVQYRYLTSRARTTADLPIRIRATSNPGGPGHEWVRARWGAWLDKPPAARPSEVLHYLPDDGPVGRRADASHPGALGRTFVPGLLAENRYLGPQYRAQLEALDPVTRRQLLEGDWDARPSRGLYFPPSSWRRLASVPPGLRCVRAWDLAASPEGDWTVGVKMGRDPDPKTTSPFVVVDVIRFRGGPADVRARVLAAALTDGPEVAIVLPQDPGQAGKDQAESYARALAGYNVRFRRPTGDKATRAAPFSAQASAGTVAILDAPWRAAFADELAGFPEWDHDDQVDAASDAFAALTGQIPGAMVEWASALAGIQVGRHEAPSRSLCLPDEDDEQVLFSRRD